MKKLFAVLGGLAAAAAVIPFGHRKDECSGEETYHALVWNAHVYPSHEDGTKRFSVNFGLTNPFAYHEEFTHYADDTLYPDVVCEEACGPNEEIPF